MTKDRITYRFKLTLPAAFTIRSLCRRRHDLRYITAVKRVEAAIKDGLVVEAGKFRAKQQRGRMQKLYVRSNVINIQLEVEKAGLKGELVLV